MDGELIYQHPQKMTFHLDPSEKEKKFERFVNRLDWRYHTEDLQAFVVSQKDGFYENRVVIDYEAPNGKIVNKGAKLSRAFKNFIHKTSISSYLFFSP